MGDGVDGKNSGWYDYDSAASGEVEEIYAQHIASGREDRTRTRVVASGSFKYEINLDNMTQTNIVHRNRTKRTIRRSIGDEDDSMQAPTKHSMKAMKRRSEVVHQDDSMRPPPKHGMKANEKRRASMKVAVSRRKAMKACSMKARRAMKTTRKPKATKKRSNVGNKCQVLNGRKLRTRGGMKAADLMKNSRGRVVSRKRHAAGVKAYETNLKVWVTACKKARIELGLTGFVAIKKGSDFYNRAKALMNGS